MKNFLFLVPFLFLANNIFSQITQIVITSIEVSHTSFDKEGKSFFEFHFTMHKIVYSLDTLSDNLYAKNYQVETIYELRNKDSTIKETNKTKQKKWSHEISKLDRGKFMTAINTNIDSLRMNYDINTTPDHSLSMFIQLINDKDTITYFKTSPFNYLTPWHVDRPQKLILNPSIDKQLVAHLPTNFLGRKEL